MKTPWWLSGMLMAALAATPLPAQEPEDASDAPVAGPAVRGEPPGTPPPAVIEAEPVAPAAPAGEVTPRPALGVRFFRGTQVVIAEVLDESPADLAGLRRGDRVISFNGTLPATSDEFIALVASAPLDAASDIVVVRGGERRSIAIDPAAWNTVFSEPRTAARYDLDDDGDADVEAVVPEHVHAPYYSSPYFVWNMSPVVVPASWYVPYPYPYPYYYTAYWGYYPAAYYWPYPYYYWTYPAAWGVAPYPYHHHHDDDAEREQDSASLNGERTVTVRFDR